MKILLFDTSANGQPLSYKASARDMSNWPRLIHLSWQMINEAGKILEQSNDYIKPSGFSVSPQIELRHHVSAETLKNEGIDVKDSIEKFMNIVPQADFVFAHNMTFNQGVVTSEADRADILERLSSADTYCLMHEATYYCAIPGKRGNYKWPSLPELHQRIFGKNYQNNSNALADLNALARCFIVMYKTGALEDIFDG